ncbi:MAG: monovalent cation/H(+) antiporter subunit G [Phycisphaerales bacterium]
MILDLLAGTMLLLGGAFSLLGAVGVIRMPDLYTRLQAATKTGTLGLGCLMVGVALHFETLGVSVRSMLVIAFLLLTAPVAGHVIARAGHRAGTPHWSRTVVDERADDEPSIGTR